MNADCVMELIIVVINCVYTYQAGLGQNRLNLFASLPATYSATWMVRRETESLTYNLLDTVFAVERIPVTVSAFIIDEIRAVVVSGTAKASTQQVNKSLTTRVFVLPLELSGYDPIRSV
ncbi:hypothetical protein J6590_026345 [Homalodisca vitripennis]|nr:hypothetical protein J6590_026345 [Homalodisca vitripennis]